MRETASVEISPSFIQVIVYRPNSSPERMTFPNDVITIGRSLDCAIPIQDRFLSRKHAEIARIDSRWWVRDCGSANGTLLNGAMLTAPVALHAGDRIALGDCEVVISSGDQSQIIAIDDDASLTRNIAIPMDQAVGDRKRERAGLLASLAEELIEDRPMSELFDFILDRVMDLLGPSRVALALLGPDKSFSDVRMRRSDATDSADLQISRTLLGEVVEERNVVSFIDTALNDKLARAESIMGQQIRSAVCAPLLVGNAVLGVLYLDFLASHGTVTTEDVRTIANIARFAAVKLETTRLREQALAKAKIDEELRTAYTIQSRLLPASLPSIAGYVFAGSNQPCKTVSGDYYDVFVRPDGQIYFVIADVAGKGITAALVMSSLATAFGIFTRSNPAPAQLVRDLNITLAPKTSPTKFVTLFAGLLDPATGTIEFANAGHVPPLVISAGGVQQLTSTDMVVGLFPAAAYRNQTVTLGAGDSLVLFTDGVTEAENASEEQLGLNPVADLLAPLHGTQAAELLATIDAHVQTFAGGVPPGDDVTMLAITRLVSSF
ncbi:MAG TPA: SpoIIE family protein phosphatase [Thermoanaerobaculia bacterium]|nr:SpoIIE family protein phosphatase [Thermoanaerobaculia bacterium]